MQDVQRIEHSGYTVRIVQDDDPPSPREWDNLGTILYTSGHYELGDKRVSADEIDAVTQRDDVIWIPVYAFIHGSIALSASASICTCPWDSGQCGIIYTDVETAKQEFGEHYSEERVREALAGEIESFGQYLAGDVYGYIVEADGEQVDSCWGFYGQEGIEDAISQGISAAEWETRQAEETACRNG